MQKVKTIKSSSDSKSKGIFGIHHVTAITSDPQRNIDFYANNLGLRFVKLTAHQGDPSSYHLYYGDTLGHPGTILTFFHWPDAPKGHRGTSEVTATSFLIPKSSVSYWINRFKSNQTNLVVHTNAFDDEEVITFYDLDRL